MSPRTQVLLAVFMTVVASAGKVSAQDSTGVTFSLQQGKLKVADGTSEPNLLELPCEGKSLVRQGDTLYVACAAAVVVVDVGSGKTPQIVGLRDLGGSVAGLFLRGDEVWVEFVRVEARPLSAATRVVATSDAKADARPPSPSASIPTQELPDAAVAEIVGWRNGEVVIAMGSEAGLTRNSHVELFVESPVDLGGGEQGIREELLAVGRAVTVTEKRAVVELGLNERIPKGAKARTTTKELTWTQMVPPRVEGLWTIEGNFRPFLALGTFGFGTISDLSLGYRFVAPVHLRARLEPIGIGIAEEGNIVAMAGNVLAGYDTTLFEVGLGLGWSAVNDAVEDGSMDASMDEPRSIDTSVDHVRDGLSIAQAIRLGALDGMNLSAYNSFLLYDGEFHYGGTTASIQVPVTSRSWLLFRGGGGIAGYGYGEIGLRVLTLGNGDHGSLFLSPSLGGAFLFGEADIDCQRYDPTTDQSVTVKDGCVDEIEYGGPMVGLGVEWRE